MKHIIDTLIIKCLFLGVIILFLHLIRKIRIILAPKDIKNHHIKFYPIRNHVDSLHFFARLLSISIILSSISIDSSTKLIDNFLYFLTWSSIGVTTFLASIYILEGIILHPFEYIDEVHNKKNYAYVIISATLSLCSAFLIKASMLQTNFHFINATASFCFLFVAFIALLKLYSKISIFNFKSYLKKKDISLSISYSGYIISIVTLCLFCLTKSETNYQTQILQIATKLVWSLMLFPLFRYAIIKVFKIQIDSSINAPEFTGAKKLGYGIFEGATFCMASIFTSILMPEINIISAF